MEYSVVKRGLLPTRRFIDNGTLDINKVANAAAKYGAIDVLLWLASQNKYPTEKGLESAKNNGHFNIVRWLE